MWLKVMNIYPNHTQSFQIPCFTDFMLDFSSKQWLLSFASEELLTWSEYKCDYYLN